MHPSLEPTYYDRPRSIRRPIYNRPTYDCRCVCRPILGRPIM